MNTSTEQFAGHTQEPLKVEGVSGRWDITRPITPTEAKSWGIATDDSRGISLLIVTREDTAAIENEADAKLWAAAPTLLRERDEWKAVAKRLEREIGLVAQNRDILQKERAELAEMLRSVTFDASATYNHLANVGTPVISLGQFETVKKARSLLARIGKAAS